MNVSLKVTEKLDGKIVVKDNAPALAGAELTTNRLDSAGKMTFTLIENSGIAITEGSLVYCTVDGEDFFKGYVFSAERDRKKQVKYTAYDQLRYLKAKASYTFVAMSLEDIIRQIASDFKLTVGDLATTGYKFPSLIKENESCLDIIFSALMETTIQTGKIFIFYDDMGKLTLKEAKSLIWDKIIGDASLLSDYSYKRDIDSQTYNRIKLARPNESTGRADTYMYEDSSTQAQWGLLQYYAVVDEAMNAAQIEEMCKLYLKYYNKVWQTLKLKNIIGYTGIRAGWVIPVRISDIDATATQRFFIAEKVSHKLNGNTHTMDIEIKNFNEVATWS